MKERKERVRKKITEEKKGEKRKKGRKEGRKKGSKIKMSACKFQCLQTCKHANPLPSIAWYSLLWFGEILTSQATRNPAVCLHKMLCAELRSILPLVCSYPEHQVVVSAKPIIITITIISINCLMLVGCLQICCLQELALIKQILTSQANGDPAAMLAQMCIQKHSAACLLLPGASG